MVSPRAIDVAGAPPAPRGTDGRGYQPSLDGLRALAVFSVMAYHAALPFAIGGWVGVDVFFVLSGFLITRLLMAAHVGHWRRTLRSFYIRRALRLLPALAVLLGFTFVAYSIVGPGKASTRETLLGVPASVFYIANWLPALGITNLGYLGHMWSLSVEEHFYLLWPMIFRALWSTSAHRTARRVCGVLLIVASWRAAMVLSGAGTNRLYAGTDTRAEELLVGCLLAVLFATNLPQLASRWRRSSHAAVIVAMASLVAVATHVNVDSRWVPRGGSTLVEIAAAVLIAHLVLFSRAVVATVLRWRPLVWLGRRSYGIYLWHLPLAGLASALMPVGTAGGRALSIALVWGSTVVIAALSYRFIERPFLNAPSSPATAVEEIDLRSVSSGMQPSAAHDPEHAVPAHNEARAL